MPTYDYVCEACGHELEIFHGMTEEPKRKCPKCGKLELQRQIGAGAGFLFKGSGFYITDYRSEGYKKAAEAENKPKTEGGGAGEGSTKTGEGSSKATESSSKKESKESKPKPPPSSASAS